MEKVTKIIDRISDIFALLAGLAMIIGVSLVLVEIVVRSVFDSTIYITQEFTAYFMVAITFFGLAYTLKEKGHIRLTFLFKLMKTPKQRAFLDIYASIIGLIIFGIITYATWDLFLTNALSGARSMTITKTYIAIPQFAMPLGSFLICLQFISEILKSMIHVKTGEYPVEEPETEALGR